MTTVKTTINLVRYNAQQVIDLYNKGLITLQEIRESNRHLTTFSDELSRWLRIHEKTEGNEEKTAV